MVGRPVGGEPGTSTGRLLDELASLGLTRVGYILFAGMGAGLGGLGGRGGGKGGVTIRYVTRYVTSDAFSLPRPVSCLAFRPGRTRRSFTLSLGDRKDLLGRKTELDKLAQGGGGKAHAALPNKSG